MKDHERFVATKSIPVLFKSRLGCKQLEFSVKSDMITQMLTDALVRRRQTTHGVNVSTWLQIKKMKAPLIIADLDVPYTDLAEIHVATSSFFQVILRGSSFSLVVFHPHLPFLGQPVAHLRCLGNLWKYTYPTTAPPPPHPTSPQPGQ